MNERKLFKSGNSLAITIPDFVVKQMGLEKGSTILLDFIDRRDGTEPFINLTKAKKEADNDSKPNIATE